MKTCKVKNCENKYYGKGYCRKHYQQLSLHGKILERTIFDKNEYINCSNHYKIYLYNRKCEKVACALIDEEDYEKVKDYKWCLMMHGYVNNEKNNILLHQLILGKKAGFDIDHINHNTLDNRKSNLRFVTRSQNCMNRKSKGYCWAENNQKWMAYIGINYKRVYLGYFENEQDAINARKEAEKKYFKNYKFN